MNRHSFLDPILDCPWFIIQKIDKKWVTCPCPTPTRNNQSKSSSTNTGTHSTQVWSTRSPSRSTPLVPLWRCRVRNHLLAVLPATHLLQLVLLHRGTIPLRWQSTLPLPLLQHVVRSPSPHHRRGHLPPPWNLPTPKWFLRQHQRISNSLLSSVPWNLCLHNVDHLDYQWPNHTNFTDGASLAHGVLTAADWHHLPHLGVHYLVGILSMFSLFTMGRLTQSQKALFLWKSPLAKLHWFSSYFCDQQEEGTSFKLSICIVFWVISRG